jgi:hypothetical protein
VTLTSGVTVHNKANGFTVLPMQNVVELMLVATRVRGAVNANPATESHPHKTEELNNVFTPAEYGSHTEEEGRCSGAAYDIHQGERWRSLQLPIGAGEAYKEVGWEYAFSRGFSKQFEFRYVPSSKVAVRMYSSAWSAFVKPNTERRRVPLLRARR